MKNSVKYAAAFAGAAVVVMGGTAFTAGNTMTDSPIAGQGTVTATGIDIDKTLFSYDLATHTTTGVVFHTEPGATQKDLTVAGYTMKLQVYDALAPTTLLATSVCSPTAGGAADATFYNILTCATFKNGSDAEVDPNTADVGPMVLTVTEDQTVDTPKTTGASHVFP